jgi:glycosyltransferase involved in cell wall biosynthesis
MADKISILILVDKFDYHGAYISGPVRNYCWLMQGIDQDRFQVYLFALRKPGRSAEIFAREGVRVGYLGLGRFNLSTWLPICRLVYRLKIDLLQVQGYGSVLFGQIAGVITGRPVVAKEEWVDLDIHPLQSFLESLLSRNLTRVIAISQYARTFLRTKKRVPDNKIVHIPNGIPLSRFRAASNNSNAKRMELGIGMDDPVVGIVGMLHANKGHRYFLAAAAMLVKKHPHSRYLIVGDGEERHRLEKLCSELGIESQVIFAGHRADIHEIYPIMDVYVLASDSETFPTSLMEAMASGRAVVSTRCGGAEELLEKSVSGILVPIRNADALAAAIGDLLGNPAKRTRLGHAAAVRSEAFDISRTVCRTQEVYELVCRNS